MTAALCCTSMKPVERRMALRASRRSRLAAVVGDRPSPPTLAAGPSSACSLSSPSCRQAVVEGCRISGGTSGPGRWGTMASMVPRGRITSAQRPS